MSPEQIHAALHQRSVSASQVADALNVSPQSVSSVIRRGRGSRRIATAIATVLEQPLDHVFPAYADADRQRRDRAATVRALSQKLSHLAA